MPLSETSTHWSGTCSRSRSVCSRLVLKVRRSRLLTPMSVAPASNTRLQVLRVVQLNQGRHSQRHRFVEKRAQVAIVQALGDQQHRVCPRRPRLKELIAVEDKILPQAWDADRRSHVAQIFELALKIRLVREHAQTRRAVLLVRSPDRDRIKIRANHTGRRAGLLHFGDQLNRALGEPRARRNFATASPTRPRRAVRLPVERPLPRQSLFSWWQRFRREWTFARRSAQAFGCQRSAISLCSS